MTTTGAAKQAFAGTSVSGPSSPASLQQQYPSTTTEYQQQYEGKYRPYTYYSPYALDSPTSTVPLPFSGSLLRNHFFTGPVPSAVSQSKSPPSTTSAPSDEPTDSKPEYLASALLQLQDPVVRSCQPHSVVVPTNNSPSMQHSISSIAGSSSTSTSSQLFQPQSNIIHSTYPYHAHQCWHPTTWPYFPFHGGHDYHSNSCHVCGKTYARPSTLRSHLKSHTGEKPYQCSFCQKSFTQAANLTAHLRIHSGEKPFKCPVCHRGFSQSSSVTTHMRTHSGDRPYKCNVCSKGFADSSTLTKHYRTHTGEKPYQCKVCEARFSQSGNLNRHMRTHRQPPVGLEMTSSMLRSRKA